MTLHIVLCSLTMHELHNRNVSNYHLLYFARFCDDSTPKIANKHMQQRILQVFTTIPSSMTKVLRVIYDFPGVRKLERHSTYDNCHAILSNVFFYSFLLLRSPIVSELGSIVSFLCLFSSQPILWVATRSAWRLPYKPENSNTESYAHTYKAAKHNSHGNVIKFCSSPASPLFSVHLHFYLHSIHNSSVVKTCLCVFTKHQ